MNNELDCGCISDGPLHVNGMSVRTLGLLAAPRCNLPSQLPETHSSSQTLPQVVARKPILEAPSSVQ